MFNRMKHLNTQNRNKNLHVYNKTYPKKKTFVKLNNLKGY